MGINVSNENVAVVNIRYSNFLGMMYISNDMSNAAIAEVRKEIGDEAVKKGFVGAGSSTASGKARDLLKAKGVVPVNITGILTGARVIEKERDGRKNTFLNVGLKDQDGKYYISVDLNGQAGQMLARKLVNAVPGKETNISLFATYEKKEGAERAYAEHGCSMLQGGEQVPGVSPKEALAPRIDAAIKALKDAGVDDKETLSKRRQVIQLEYHKELMKGVEAMFSSYYEGIGAKPAASATHSEDVSDVSEDFSDIPF
jgi:hypothetical protein